MEGKGSENEKPGLGLADWNHHTVQRAPNYPAVAAPARRAREVIPEAMRALVRASRVRWSDINTHRLMLGDWLQV